MSCYSTNLMHNLYMDNFSISNRLFDKMVIHNYVTVLIQRDCCLAPTQQFLYACLLRRDVLWYTNVRLSVRPFHMSRSNLRTPWPIHFKFHRVIGIDGLTVCILYVEISNFHSRVMGLYSSNCRRFFRMSRCKLRTPWPIHFKLHTVIGIDSLTVYFLVKFQFFIPELWDFIHQIVGDFSYVAL